MTAMIRPFLFAAMWLSILAVSVLAQGQAETDSTDQDYSSELPRIAPLEPDEALSSFTVADGFRIELVAAEPLVNDPIAMAFDEKGRLFVVEMRGYSEDPDDKLGRIRLLVDEDQDGVFDTSRVYADQLSWPTAVACYDGGIFVGAPPDLLYFKDTDGNRFADRQELLFTGFGRANVQGMMNSFHWGLDNHIYGSSGTQGGQVTSARLGAPITAEKTEPSGVHGPLELRGRNFSIEPRTMTMNPVSGGGQHGMSFNNWGHTFLCSNSNHAKFVRYEDRYLARNPYFAAPAANVSIAEDGPQAAVFRTSPVEPWRIVRTRLRIKGIVPGPVEGGGTAAGYFTSATGITIYRGSAWPQEYVGWAIVADVGSNLIHRKRVIPRGAGYTAQRVDDRTEFVSSSDIWFRPVQFAHGPDGALYVADMYREVVEHPASLHPVIKKHLDLTSGRGRGRIYRIVPDDFEQPRFESLDRLELADLVLCLQHPNGWHRDTAARLLYERHDRRAIPLLRASLDSIESNPVGRIHVLYVLQGLGALTDDDVLREMDDEHPRVREHAIRLSEPLAAHAPRIRQRLYKLTEDADLRVRIQVALTLGELTAPQRLTHLAKLIVQDGENAAMRVAVMSSLRLGTGQVLVALAQNRTYCASSVGQEWLKSLAAQIGKQQDPADVAAVLSLLRHLPDEHRSLIQVIVEGLAAPADSELARQLTAVTGGRADELMADLLEQSVEVSQDEEATVSERVSAIGRLQLGTLEANIDLFAELLQPNQPKELPIAAVKTLATFQSPGVANLLIDQWPALTPQVRARAADVLFSRDHWLEPLLNAMQAGQIAPADLGATRLQLLGEHPDEKISQLAQQILQVGGSKDRAEVVMAYQPVLTLAGDIGRGKQVFEKICAACHRVQGVGHPLGPNLAAMKNRGRAAILSNVLDPNREVNPQYLNYLLFTQDGRSLTGMIAAETATSVTLQRDNKASDTVLRVDIEQLRSTSKSIMPEGLEKQIDQQAMADLIEYLMSVD